jgi:hypothetical protein
MNANQSYRINHPAVIAEVIDDEAIVVNLDSGAYYSLRNSACAIWELLTHHHTLSEVVASARAMYTGAADEIRDGVARLLDELVTESLLVPTDAAPADTAPATSVLKARDEGDRPVFGQPVLEKFTDMADLLLLDPIHEVGEAGWPQRAPQ